MTKIIKEIIIMLLICLISMLVLAVVLYDYIPNKKQVAEVRKYTTSQKVEEQMADDIDSEEKEVVLRYEVTSKDLSAYEITNEYVPGKDDPFALYSLPYYEPVDDENNVIDDNTVGNTTTQPEENDIETNTYIENEIIK